MWRSSGNWPYGRAPRQLRPVLRLRGPVRFRTGVMDVSRTIKCASFWDVLVLRSILEERGVRVHSPDEGVVALSMVVSGPVDGIKAAAAELTVESPRSGPVIIGDEDHDKDADTEQFAAIGDHITDEAGPAGPAQSEGARRCTGSTSKGRQCKLSAEPGGALCAIHAPKGMDDLQAVRLL